MNDALILVVAGAAGLFLGTVFFGGLWWTVRKGVSSPRPVLWFVGSLLLRMGIVLIGFYFVGGGQWQRLLGCLLGFITARFLVMRLTRARLMPVASLEHPDSAAPNSDAKEASHAS